MGERSASIANEDGRLFLISREELDSKLIDRSTLLTTLSSVPGQDATLPFDSTAFQAWSTFVSNATPRPLGLGPGLPAPKETRETTDVAANMKVCPRCLLTALLQVWLRSKRL